MKIGIIGATILISIILLLPSILPEDSALLEYLPSKKLNLGLDLQGGIHVVLGVEVEKALEVEIDRFFGDLKGRLEEEKLPVSRMERSRGERSIVIAFRNEQDGKAFEKMLRDDFYQILTISHKDNQLTYHIVLEPDHETYIKTLSLEQAREVIRNRVDEFGVAEPTIQVQGTDRILVQLPGVQDPDRAIELIGKTALLEFKLVDETLNTAQLDALVENVRESARFVNNFTSADLRRLNVILAKDLPKGTEISFEKEVDRKSGDVILVPYLLNSTTQLTGQALEDARVTSEQTTQRPQASLSFTKKGANSFEKLTEENVGAQLAILLDGVVVSAPQIRERIPAISAGAVITLGRGNRQAMLREARDLALVLRSGALPAPVEILENRTVGASLGEDSIQSGKTAALIGIILIVLFMLFYYRASGALANMALLLNILMLMAIMALFQATLTLPGIAGIVLTLGMAVDANVIILERIREELRSRTKVRAAVEAGYQAAQRAIFDANLTTVIAGVVLFNFGTGPIRGFAVTLLVGIICNYICAVWFSRWVYEWIFDRRNVVRLSI